MNAYVKPDFNLVVASLGSDGAAAVGEVVDMAEAIGLWFADRGMAITHRDVVEFARLALERRDRIRAQGPAASAA